MITKLIFTTVALLAVVISFFSFANPQTGKWVYMWQAYIIPAENPDVMSQPVGTLTLLRPSKEFFDSSQKRWWFWNSEGVRKGYIRADDGRPFIYFYTWQEEDVVKITRHHAPENLEHLNEHNAWLVYDRVGNFDWREHYEVPIEW